MACLGVHFAVNNEQYQKLLSIKSDAELIALIQEEIEAKWDKEWLHETDKSWDAIHRCLTDGKLEWQNGTFPLNAVILGGMQLHRGDNYIVTLLTPEQVTEAAKSLGKVDLPFLNGAMKILSKQNMGAKKDKKILSALGRGFRDYPNYLTRHPVRAVA